MTKKVQLWSKKCENVPKTQCKTAKSQSWWFRRILKMYVQIRLFRLKLQLGCTCMDAYMPLHWQVHMSEQVFKKLYI